MYALQSHNSWWGESRNFKFVSVATDDEHEFECFYKGWIDTKANTITYYLDFM